jgi:glycosyltransferase involved in cell wall biosynthesis
MSRIKKKHILILGVDPHSIINFRKDLILELLARGNRVTAVAMEPSDQQIRAIRALGADVKSVSFSRAGMNPLSDIKTFLLLARLFHETKPDHIIAYTVKPVVYGALIASLVGAPRFTAMITGLGYSFIEGTGIKRRAAHFFASFLYKSALKTCNAIIFQNRDDLVTFEKFGLLNVKANIGIVNGSGVDLGYFEQSVLPKEPVFLMIARLLADKGTREYAEASLRLRKLFPAARTLLVGALDPSPNSVNQTELDGWIKEGIEYLGQLADVRPAIRSASIVVLPSYREGTPRAVLEGMAMGRAIITTDAPGCRETVVDHVNGLLIPPRNADALFGAMKTLATDSVMVESMGKAARQLAEEKYEGRSVAVEVLRISEL